jgi:hypothetical protein
MQHAIIIPTNLPVFKSLPTISALYGTVQERAYLPIEQVDQVLPVLDQALAILYALRRAAKVQPG